VTPAGSNPTFGVRLSSPISSHSTAFSDARMTKIPTPLVASSDGVAPPFSVLETG
jgi:hypothetical protein